MRLTLERFAYTNTETQGRLICDGQEYWTIERPWFRYRDPGGEPFKSCIPDGQYDLRKFTRPNGQRVYALFNPDHGVWMHKDDRTNGTGRFLILIHAGNTVHDVVGCIAPGESRVIHNNQVFVTNSRATSNAIFSSLNADTSSHHTILIQSALGAVD